MNDFKSNICEETDKIKEDIMLLKSMYEKIIKENYNLMRQLKQNEPEPEGQIEIAAADLYKCKHYKFKCMDRF